MIQAYKEHSQFILILAVMYVIGVWGGPLIYPIYPLVLFVFGLKKFYFELFILALWTLMLADYVPVENATYDDLEFAKVLKPLVPVVLFLVFLRDRESFKPYSKVIIYFIPFLAIATLGLTDSINIQIGVQKTISYVLMYLVIPMYTVFFHRKYGERFWKALMTFIIGMLSIGIVLRFAAPDIAMKVGRFKGVLGNPNGLGVFLNLTYIMWILIEKFGFARFTRKERTYILFVLILSVIWTGSRNGMMSMFIFYIMYKVVRVNWFLAIILIASILTFSDQLFDVFIVSIEFFGLESFFRVKSLEEGSGRAVAWVFAWQEIQKYFFIGGGFGHDEQIMRPNYYWLSRQGHQGGVHNSYLSMWFDAGVLGIIAYFTGLLAILSTVIRDNYLILAFLVSLGFNIYFESWLVASLNPFTIIYLVILAIFVGKLKGEYYHQPEAKVND